MFNPYRFAISFAYYLAQIDSKGRIDFWDYHIVNNNWRVIFSSYNSVSREENIDKARIFSLKARKRGNVSGETQRKCPIHLFFLTKIKLDKFLTESFAKIDVDAFQLQIRVTMVVTTRIYAVLVSYDFPELPTETNDCRDFIELPEKQN